MNGLERYKELEAALRVVEDAKIGLYRDAGYGASDMVGQCGEVTRRGRLLARVSYNGRVWVDGKPVDGMSGAEWIAQARGVGVTL